jgi:hypothetical protein
MMGMKEMKDTKGTKSRGSKNDIQFQQSMNTTGKITFSYRIILTRGNDIGHALELRSRTGTVNVMTLGKPTTGSGPEPIQKITANS